MPATRSPGLRVVSYNIHRAIGIDRRFRLDRIIAILAHHSGDIVLLQEVDDGAPRSKRLDLAAKLAESLGYDHYAVGHNVELRGGGRYGNATLSRHPILYERNIDLSIGLRKRRGCQHTRVEVGFGRSRQQLEIFNLHLGLSARERKKQVKHLLRASELASLDTGTPCVIGGDFNDWRSQVRPLLTKDHSFRSATDLSKNGNGHRLSMRTFPSFSPAGALDRIYYRGGLELSAARRCRLSLSKRASDHLPIIADFHLR